MAKPKPVHNNKYTELLYLIFVKNLNTPKALRKHYSVDFSKASRMSMPLQNLRKLGFINNQRLRSINRSSTSKYELNKFGFIEYIYTNFFRQKLIYSYSEYEDLIIAFSYYLKVALAKNSKSLYTIMEDFIIGIGMPRFAFRKSITLSRKLSLDKGTLDFLKKAQKYYFNTLNKEKLLANQLI